MRTAKCPHVTEGPHSSLICLESCPPKTKNKHTCVCACVCVCVSGGNLSRTFTSDQKSGLSVLSTFFFFFHAEVKASLLDLNWMFLGI